ncbi:MAG: GNAT family N-acetyltransferase [Faecousia sp.]
MLSQVKYVDENVTDKLFQLYKESMADMADKFSSDLEMKEAYASFLKDFIEHKNQLVLVENVDGEWMSGLRAVESKPGHWFIEAVETMPDHRHNGYGRMLLLDTIEFLGNRNAKTLECIIADNNEASISLHSGCGFIRTNAAPVNCWDEYEDGGILFRLEL